MSFDWMRFFEQHRIEYSESGPAVSRGNVAIHCPFCGPPYERMRMSVNLEGRGFRCFVRSQEHRGKNPARLVQALLRCDWDRANYIVGNSVLIPNDFLARVQGALSPPDVPRPLPLKMPSEFKAFAGLPSSRLFVRYLRDRGFSDRQVERLTDRYGVRYCTRGAYSGRIIFPIVHKGDLISWTGRSIDRDAQLRYRALSTDPERTERDGYKPAVGAVSHYLMWYDMLRDNDADTILLVEGPFDALKVNVLGRRAGICATCFQTAQPTGPQIDLLRSLLRKFKRKVLLLDRGTFAMGIRVALSLSSLGVTSQQIPSQLKDPGEFDVSTFEKFVIALRRGSMS